MNSPFIIIKSLSYCCRIKTSSFRPFSNGKGFSFMKQNPISSGVPTLFFFGSPIAILWCVIPVVISTFKRMFIAWFSSHISQKLFEGIHPLITNFNSSPSPSFKAHCFRIITPISHSQPRNVFGSSAKSMFKSIFTFATA